jgi:CHAT domain-containing protein
MAHAERALALARVEGDPEAEVASLHALSWAQHVLGDPRTLSTARAGIRLARRHGDRRRAALLRRRLALSLADKGSTEAAWREIDAAIAELRGAERAQSEVFRLAILRAAKRSDSGVHREVLASAAAALRLLKRNGDDIWRARIRFNRGLVHWERGELQAAEADLRAAHGLYEAVGAEAAAVDTVAALAEVSLARGEVVECLRTIEHVKARLTDGELVFGLDACHASALAQARRIVEAQALMTGYLERRARAGHLSRVSSRMLDLATMAMLGGDLPTAGRVAKQAERWFAARGQPVGAARARAIWLRARLQGGDLPRGAIRRALDAVDVLSQAGWRREALRTRLLVSRIALAHGSSEAARTQLKLASALSVRGTVTDRIELCYVRALVRLAEGNSPAAVRLLGGGLRLLEDYRAAFGAVEFRATASGLGTELSELGLRIALDTDKPAAILVWAEHLRGNALRLPLVRPPADPELRARQTELRQVASQIRQAENTGKPARGLVACQVELEAAIRARSRLVRGHGGAVAPIPRPREAVEALGERVLVEYVELDGVMRAVTLACGRTALHELAAVDAAAQLEWLRFALRRWVRGGTSSARRAAHLANAHAAAAELERMLLEPLLPVLGDAPLVVVPTGELHALPWSALPSLRDRPVTVAPSLSLWVDRANRLRSRRRNIALVAGPHLRHATREVRELATVHPRAAVLHGDEATAGNAMSALDGAAVAHVACHGRFRADSPLFSSLELADGPLNVHELQRLRRAPELLVLSSCDLALSERHPGDELLGLAAALLAMGTRTIVASVVPVPDAAARRLMLAFHSELAAGAPPATALARAQAALHGRSAALAGFVCLGVG